MNKLYNVENSGYDAVVDLVRHSAADELYLMLQDNFFNRSKSEVLLETLQSSKIKNLVINNVAGGFDADGSNFSNFEEYMKPFKSAIPRSDISWATKIVL